MIDLIDAGQFDDAEAAAQDLLVRYPEGLERIAIVAAARGDRARAARVLPEGRGHS